MKLDEIRSKITRIDYEIINLLHKRMELSLRTKKFKSHITDEEREKIVFKNINRISGGLIFEEFSQKLFHIIVTESKRLQL